MSATAAVMHSPTGYGRPWSAQGVVLAHGTEVRIEHLGRVFHGRIEDGEWAIIDQKGKKHLASSPSRAAALVCKTEAGEPMKANGWQRWEVRISQSRLWVSLDELRPSSHR
jgi:hypothetical protein